MAVTSPLQRQSNQSMHILTANVPGKVGSDSEGIKRHVSPLKVITNGDYHGGSIVDNAVRLCCCSPSVL